MTRRRRCSSKYPCSWKWLWFSPFLGKLHRAARGVVWRIIQKRLYGKKSSQKTSPDKSGKVSAKGDMIDQTLLKAIVASDIQTIPVRSILNWNTRKVSVSTVYGSAMDLARNRLVDIGTPIGIVAAQSIGELVLSLRCVHIPLRMSRERRRRYHDWSHPCRRTLWSSYAKISGKISYIDGEVWRSNIQRLHLWSMFVHTNRNSRILYTMIMNRKWRQVIQSRLNKHSLVIETKQKSELRREAMSQNRKWYYLCLRYRSSDSLEYVLHLVENSLSHKALKSQRRQALWRNIDAEELMTICYSSKAQQYIVDAVKEIYASQGPDSQCRKHISCIVRQMFSKSQLLSQVIQNSSKEYDRYRYIQWYKTKTRCCCRNKPIGQRLVLGIAKSLSTQILGSLLRHSRRLSKSS